ncbi:MAG: FkbM family methyltransferase [Planctomycetota bacterium]
MLRKLAKRARMARWGLAWRRFRWRVSGALCGQITVDTRQGKLTVSTADQIIGKSLFLHGGFEDAYVAATLSFLRAEGMLPAKGTGTVVDIGANLGVISIGMMRDAEFARAIAIEPDPYNFSLLQRNTRQNGLTPATFACLRRAVSDRAGEVPFELSKDNFGDHRVRELGDEGNFDNVVLAH